jgi:lipid A ethanolaminephosphotransferase
MNFFSWTMSSTRFTFVLSSLLIIFYNTAFFYALAGVIDFNSVKGFCFGISVSLLVGLLTAIVLSWVILPYIAKPLIIFILFGAAIVSYFMNAYGIVIHPAMIQNTFETDVREASSLVNSTLFVYLMVLGVIPSVLIARVKLEFKIFYKELFGKVKLIAACLIAAVLLIMPFTADYASFFRNNKNIRYMANPVNFIYGTFHYALSSNKSITISPLGLDATLGAASKAFTKPTLFVLVVGETARADHFSINGYRKPTTPLLARQNIINYAQVTSCGTETAVSVPCMFSNLGRAKYSDKKAKSQEGLLDILQRSGYAVRWRDNNSGCKGTCARVAYDDIAHKNLSALCDDHGCFDMALLEGLDEIVSGMSGSKVIVLHQDGSHGPEYYRRYPSAMEIFKPVCKVNKLQNCSSEEINNAFDNTIHYTDYFLNNTIEWLKKQSDTYNTALIYLSDHGESLGEKNLYLHGMPYLLAPQEQKHIPFFFWFSENFASEAKINSACLHGLTNREYSQDNLFHTTLGLLNVKTSLYNAQLDMVNECRQQ